MPDEPVRLGSIASFHFFPVPHQLFIADSMRHNAQKRALGQRTGVAKIAGGVPAFFAGFDPFGVMPDGVWDGLCGGLEALEFFLRQKLMPAVV